MEAYLGILKTTPFFRAMSDGEVLSVLGCMGASAVFRPKGSFILRAGSSTEAMGILLTGRALILQEDVWGRRSILDNLTPGDSFGEVFAASMGSCLSVSVVAEADCQVLLLNVGRLLSTCPNTCAHHAQLIRNLVHVIASKTLRIQEKLNHMSRRTTREKLLSYLSAQAERSGSLTFTIPYNRQQLADYLCVERAAMSVALSQLQREGLLQYRKNEFTLHTPQQAQSTKIPPDQ
ncbi:MAG: Crp/Fnr family transcriptional regulator [Eubacteriales bacterium]|nr:Crp/Fnr family transcriptional regulator [Eubacteriales bacterium]